MTNKEKVFFVTFFFSILGLTFSTVFNPLENHIGRSSFVIASEYVSKLPVLEGRYIYKNEFKIEREESISYSTESKMVNMLSTVLNISTKDVRDALDGGAKPSEMLASVGILLSDLSEEFNFDIVGERELVKFRA